MKIINVVLLVTLFGFFAPAFGQVAINTDGASADGTAILDVKSTSQGLLIPRMSTANRIGITDPANGLLVFDTDTKSVWFYELTTTSWKEIYGSNNNTTLADADGNTKVEVEQTPDENTISLTMNGTEFFVFDSARIEVLNSGGSVFIGEDAGKNDDYTENRNVAIGKNALHANVANSRSTAIGYEAMAYADSRTTGRETFNTALGYRALKGSGTATLNTGQYNTATGDMALTYNTSGSSNTAIGSFSMERNESGAYNVAVGYEALLQNKTGGSNVAIGTWALTRNVAKSDNIAIGTSALFFMNNSTTSSRTYNIAIGTSALRGSMTPENNTGTENVSVGHFSTNSITSGSKNTAFGYKALQYNDDGSYNTALGYSCLYNLGDGNNNVAIGGNTGDNLSSGSSNIFIGYNASAPVTTGSNQLNIGNTIYGTGIDLITHKIGIGVASPDEELDVRGNFQVKQSSAAVTANIESATAAATLFIKSSGSNLGQITFFDNAVYGASFGYSNDNDRIFLWHGSNNIFFDNGAILPGVHKGGDLGADGQAWDDIYYDDLHNQGAAAFVNRSVSEEIVNHPPTEKAAGSFDYRTKRGDVELDPLSLPKGLHDETSILTDEVVTYNYKANYEQQLQINELKKIIEQQNEKIEQLIKLVSEK